MIHSHRKKSSIPSLAKSSQMMPTRIMSRESISLRALWATDADAEHTKSTSNGQVGHSQHGNHLNTYPKLRHLNYMKLLTIALGTRRPRDDLRHKGGGPIVTIYGSCLAQALPSPKSL